MTEPLLQPWPEPFGAPPFDRLRVDAVIPALEAAIAEHRAELDVLVQDPAPATFANTVEALERAGAPLGRARRLFSMIAGCCSDAAVRAIEPQVSALLTAHVTATNQDARLFARVATVWAQREALALDEERDRLLRATHRGFVAGGATLQDEARLRFAEIDVRLVELSVRFGQNVLAAAAGWEMLLAGDELDGLPESLRGIARERAAAAGVPGALLTLGRGDVEDVLTFSTRRDVRERIWRAFTGRCDGGVHDNNPIVAEMAALRAEKARLLGHPSFAAYRLEDEMAGTPEAATALLESVWPAARAQALREAAALQARIDAEGGGFTLEPWDWRFYAEAERRERYGLDAAAVRGFLPADRVVDAAFDVAGRLFGLRFERHGELAGWHPDVAAYAVRGEGDAPVGLLYVDPTARPGKHGGAWMASLRAQERLDGPVTPVVSICCNFAGAAAPLSIDEARTFFHEFGHALHALLSDVTYPSLAGTAVPRDFVEFPSKLMENWMVVPAVLAGLGMPDALVAALGRADGFGQGFATVEFLLSGLVDMAIHASRDAAPDIAAIEAAMLVRLDPPHGVTMRHRLPHFTHLFDGGYAAAYYSYLWSEVLDADAWGAFAAAGVFDPDLARRYRDEVLSRGDTRDPMASYRAFLGRNPDETALITARKLTPYLT
ncbi:M3 family metallopeptidase [Sphingomonas sp.]|uniref:M3 family metallopeptidase n=1 Tax=Sphingomonas sp. TaxID=28214 RepID=UPI003B00F2F2